MDIVNDRLRSALTAIVRSVLPRVEYLGYFPARVLADHGDMTLDLEPDDPKLPKLVKVPLRPGLPGIKVEVLPGARVLVAFEGGDLTRPAAHLWEIGSLKALTIEATVEVTVKAPLVKLADGGLPVARVGDAVVAGGMAGTITGPGNPKVLA